MSVTCCGLVLKSLVYGGYTGGAENGDAYILELDKWVRA